MAAKRTKATTSEGFETVGEALAYAYDAAQVQQTDTLRAAHATFEANGMVYVACIVKVDPESPGVGLTKSGENVHAVAGAHNPLRVPVARLAEHGHGAVTFGFKYIMVEVSDERMAELKSGKRPAQPRVADVPGDSL